MTTVSVPTRLAHLEGCQVNVALRSGERIDDCQLVSTGRARRATLWLFTNGVDTFVPVAQVAEIWPAVGPAGTS
jgi:hypothetical protein